MRRQRSVSPAEPLRVPCPKCKAEIDQLCMESRRKIDFPHIERREYARRVAKRAGR